MRKSTVVRQGLSEEERYLVADDVVHRLKVNRDLATGDLSSRRTGMNDARRKEIHRAVVLIEEAKGILETALAGEQNDFENMPEDLQDSEIGETAEDAADALERAVICCDETIVACAEATQD